jgi:hypothetical protein
MVYSYYIPLIKWGYFNSLHRPDILLWILEEPINLLITKELMFISGMLNNQVDIIA